MNNKMRDELVKKFLKLLKEEDINWKNGWMISPYILPENLTTNSKYNGVNKFNLLLETFNEGYDDPRWCTFNQLKKNGWTLENAKDKGKKIEYWFPVNIKTKKSLGWADYNKLSKEEKYDYRILPKIYSVFNASLIKGCPEYIRKKTSEKITQIEAVKKLANKMNIKIIETAGNKVAYFPTIDEIRVPFKEMFKDDYSYNETLLHELSHATGHKSRLNRKINGAFGSKEYAFEELIANISSMFMVNGLGFNYTNENLENHKAYVQSWIKIIKDKPTILFEAIKEAEKVASYMDYLLEMKTKEEHEKTVNTSIVIEVNQEKQKELTKSNELEFMINR
jgi:Antirestriction protein